MNRNIRDNIIVPFLYFFYKHYFWQFGDGGNHTGERWSTRRAHIANGIWCMVCGSYYDDLAIEHFKKAIT